MVMNKKKLAPVTETNARRKDNVTGFPEEDDILEDIEASRAVITKNPNYRTGWNIEVYFGVYRLYSGKAYYYESSAMTKAGATRKAKRKLAKERRKLYRKLENIREPLVIK